MGMKARLVEKINYCKNSEFNSTFKCSGASFKAIAGAQASFSQFNSTASNVKFSEKNNGDLEEMVNKAFGFEEDEKKEKVEKKEEKVNSKENSEKNENKKPEVSLLESKK